VLVAQCATSYTPEASEDRSPASAHGGAAYGYQSQVDASRPRAPATVHSCGSMASPRGSWVKQSAHMDADRPPLTHIVPPSVGGDRKGEGYSRQRPLRCSS
jgi:hypothetical protein